MGKNDTLNQILYATDASVYRIVPDKVIFPKTEEALIEAVLTAKSNGTSITARTAGTSLAGQVVNKGIIADFSRYMTAIKGVDTKSSSVVVQPGVVRDELNNFLADYALFFGPNTSTSNRCMIGGMVGNNSSGTTSIKYGVTRDHVKKIRAVLSDGSVAEFESLTVPQWKAKCKLNSLEGAIYRGLDDLLSSPANCTIIRQAAPDQSIHRRNDGYSLESLLDFERFGGSHKTINLAKLLCGSEGTLALTSEISLNVLPVPPENIQMILAHFHSIPDCLRAVKEVMKHDLYLCEMIDKTILDCTKRNRMYAQHRQLLLDDPRGVLMLELRHQRQDELIDQVTRLLDTLQNNTAAYAMPVLDKKDAQRAFELRKAGLGLLGNMVGDRKAVACIEDTAVSLDDLDSYIQEFTSLMELHEQEAVYYAHAGAGELHLRPILNLKKSGAVEQFESLTRDVSKLVNKYNGSMSGEHGDGIVRGSLLPETLGADAFRLMRQVKNLFDPDGIFNPGKMVDSYPITENLRYKPDRKEPEIPSIQDFSDVEGIHRMAENCNGSGDCRKQAEMPGVMCPSYRATREEKDTTRARANILREVFTQASPDYSDERLWEALDLCVSCKACATECPSSVDVGAMKAEVMYQRMRQSGKKPPGSHLLNGVKHAQRFYRLNRVFNAFAKAGLLKPLNSFMGIHPKRSLPKLSTFNLKTYLKKIIKNQQPSRKSIYIFLDEFTLSTDAEIGKDSIDLLISLGYELKSIDHAPSGRGEISKGLLDLAKSYATQNLNLFTGKIDEHTPLVGIEPSAILTFRDEYRRLLGFDKLSDVQDKVLRNAFTIEEFLARENDAGNISADLFDEQRRDIKLHVHCHHKVIGDPHAVYKILSLPVNHKVKLIASSCCGMAGSFGYEKEHYDVSMKMGELSLFPKIRKTDRKTYIVANGTSCRHQILDGTERKALHPVSLLKNCLR